MWPPSSRKPPLHSCPDRSAIGSFLFGYDSGIIGSVISESYDNFHEYFDHPGENVTGAVVSVFAGGAFCKDSHAVRLN